MATTLLVSENKIKSWTNINRNVDVDAIKAEIGIAQDIHLMPILGAKFYYHLLDQVTSTGNTFNSDELTLINEYVSPYLIQVSYFELIPHLHYRSMNVGIVGPSGLEGGRTGVDSDTMKYLRNIQKQRADFYKQRLQDYLLTGRGQGKFPQYDSYSTIDGITPMKNEKYNSPIYLNHTTRYGWSDRRTRYLNQSNGIPWYSEWDIINDPCWGCQ
jgi:hypothetical protein